MPSSVFNAITYANKLKEAGMATRIADIEAEQMSDLINNDLVTKTFLASELSKLELKLTIKLGAIMVAGMGVLGFVLKY